MGQSDKHDERIAGLSFSDVYPLYLAKVERKGRTQKELDQVIHWLTGFSSAQIKKLLHSNLTFAEFFEKATLHPNASLIKGSICGVRVEAIKTPLTQKIRYLDKLVDELAKGKKLESILRE